MLVGRQPSSYHTDIVWRALAAQPTAWGLRKSIAFCSILCISHEAPTCWPGSQGYQLPGPWKALGLTSTHAWGSSCPCFAIKAMLR